jgi:Tfp pilus assembly protein PilF
MGMLHPRRPAPRLGLCLGLCLALFAGALGSGCASAPPPKPVMEASTLLADGLFASPGTPFDAKSLFALDDAMRAYVQNRLPLVRPDKDNRRALLQALFESTELKLRYDGGYTRTAAEAFSARAGNCLSLVIMTAAFAKHLDVPLEYRSVAVPDTYSRSGELYMASRHVNLSLGPPTSTKAVYRSDQGHWLTVDFLPAEDLGRQRVTTLTEAAIVAMYLNNRAAEALSDGSVDQAYHWARLALLQDPQFVTAINTLAVVYQRAGHLPQAEQALRRVLLAEPENTAALSNLAGLLERTGRSDEAAAVALKLARLQPVPPFHDFNLGRKAMAAGDFASARKHFDAELQRQPYQDEVHFWLAQAHWRLGHAEEARQHLKLAAENSITDSSQARYAAKLALLKGPVQAH